MTMDARKQRVLQAIVALYGLEGEPVGSSVLANYFDMAVSSATLRNEMAALTKLGLLEQPHTSAGRVPSAKGYRYYLDNLLTDDQPLDRVSRARMASGVRCSAPDFLRDCRFSRRPGKTYNSAVSLRAVSRLGVCGNSGCQALGRRYSVGTGFRRDICNAHTVPLVCSLPRVVRRAAYESCFHAAHPSGRRDRLAHRQKAKQRRKKH